METKTSADGTEEAVQCCNHRTCQRYYHRSCLESDPLYNEHTTLVKSGGFTCPVHHCWTCFERGDFKSVANMRGQARRTCRHCPRSYHRTCVPPTAELLSVQRCDTDKVIANYPPFRYDAMTCSSNDHLMSPENRLWPLHPKPRDLQYGRDDEKHGIFKWKMWDGTVAEFYSLEDDPFSLPTSMVKEYEKKVERASKRREERAASEGSEGPKWQKGFKKISKC